MSEIPDVHNNIPKYQLRINRVGISNIRLPPINSDGFWLVPILSIYVDLPETMRGFHASRVYKAAYNELRGATSIGFELLEAIGEAILRANEYANVVDITLKAKIIAEERGREYYGSDRVSARLVMSRRGVLLRESTASMLTVTACPCALEVSKVVHNRPYTHNSQLRVTSTIKSRSSNKIIHPLEIIHEMSNILIRPRNYMKRVDEAHFIKSIVESPLFAEDVVRLVAHTIFKNCYNLLGPTDEVIVKAKSIEPIHEYGISVMLKLKAGERLNDSIRADLIDGLRYEKL